MHFSPKILGLNVRMFGTVFGQSKTMFEDWFWSRDLCLRVLLCVLVFGCVWLSFNALRVCLALFFPKGLFGKIMGYGNSAMF